MLTYVKISTLLIVVCFSCSATELAGTLDDKIRDDRGGFSIQPPKGWKEVEFPGSKYKALKGERKNGFSPNVVFSDYPINNGESLDSYVDRNMVAVELATPHFKLLKRFELKLNSGSTAVAVITSNEQNNIKVQQSYYMLDGIDHRRWIICCSTLVDDTTSEETLAASVKTFVHEKPGSDKTPISIKLEPGARYVESKGHYSFVPPEKWELRNAPNYEYKAVYGPIVDKTVVRMTFVDEKSNLSLNDYATQVWTNATQSHPEVEKLEQSELKLDSGDRAVRIRGHNKSAKTQLNFYFIKGESAMLMISARAPEDWDGFPDTSDTCVKTLKFEKQ